MDTRVLLGCLVLALSLDAGAGDIFKCVEGGATTYQSMPCARVQASRPLTLANAPPTIANAPPTMLRDAALPMPRKRGPWTRTSIEVGMSDDEVLNLPGWGRPAHISRARVSGGWQEVWRYGNSLSGERELRFVNARLADISEAPGAQASAEAR